MSKIVGFELTAQFLYPEGAPDLHGLREPFLRFETEFHSRLQSYFRVDRVSHQRLKTAVEEYRSEWWLEAGDVKHALEIFRKIMNGPVPEVIEVVASTILAIVVPNKPKVAVSVTNVKFNISETDLERAEPRPPATAHDAGPEGVRDHLAWQLRRLTPSRALAAVGIAFAVLFLYNGGLKLVDAWADNLRRAEPSASSPQIQVRCEAAPERPEQREQDETRAFPSQSTPEVNRNYARRRDCPGCPVVTHMGGE